MGFFLNLKPAVMDRNFCTSDSHALYPVLLTVCQWHQFADSCDFCPHLYSNFCNELLHEFYIRTYFIYVFFAADYLIKLRN